MFLPWLANERPVWIAQLTAPCGVGEEHEADGLSGSPEAQTLVGLYGRQHSQETLPRAG
jgi:hypothetical protein